MRRIGLLGSLVLVSCLALSATARADEITFSGPGVAIPDIGASTSSTIDISGFDGPITNAKATLGTVTHTRPVDIDSAIIAPNGVAVSPMSDACGFNGIASTLQFDDDAATPLNAVGSCPPGQYKPTNLGVQGDPIAANNALSFFEGGGPNGTWTLLIADDAAGDIGTIGGWSLTLDGLTVSGAGSAPNPESVRCAGRPSTQLGTEGNDEMRGTSGRDVISGVGGKDEISGLNGKDVICGGDGKDVLRGGKGKDKLLGQSGKDKLRGGKGKDILKGGGGKDNERE